MRQLSVIASALALAFAGGCANLNTDFSQAQQVMAQGQAKAQGQYREGQVWGQDYVLEELGNGLRVLVVKTAHPNVVSLQIPVQTGSRNEVEPGKTGFAHFFEHMMFKGTPNYPQAVYDDILKNAGVDNRAYTTDDYTNYHLNFSKEHLETVLRLEADRFQNLSYTESQFRTEALTVKGEYLKNYASPIRKLLSEARATAFDRHTYRHTTMGFFEDIENMPNQMDYAARFFKRWYGPQNTTLVLTGDLDPAQTLAWVKRYWGDWQGSDYRAEIPVEPAQQGARYSHLKVDGTPGAWLAVSFKGPAFGGSDKAAVDLIDALYFSNTSDFYQEVVVNRQLADQFFSYFPDNKDPGLMTLFAHVKDVAALAEVRDAIARTLVKARSEPVSAKRLAELKANLKYGQAAGLDSNTAIGGALARYVHFERDPEVVNALAEARDALTPVQIQAVANRYFVDDGRTTVTLSAGEAVPGFERELSMASLLARADRPVDNGRHIKVLDKRSGSPLIDINLLFNTGPAFEPEGKRGVAALTALMLSDAGTKELDYKALKEAYFPMAAGVSSQVDKEMVSLRGRVHQDNLEAYLPLLIAQITEPGFRDSDFERLKKQLINAIETDLKAGNDEELGKEVLYLDLYQDHPYGSLNLGDLSDLRALTLADVKTFYASQFSQANLTLGLAGSMGDAAKARLEQALSRLPVGQAQAAIPAAPELRGWHATLVEKDTQATAVSFGFPIDLKRGDQDWLALWLARSYLGQHRSSNALLYQRIRQERGMNYGDYAYIEYFPRGMYQTKPDANLGRSEQIFQVWLRPLRSNNDALFATRTALHELHKLIDEGMSEESFQATRNFLKNFVAQRTAGQGQSLGYALDSDFYRMDDFLDYVRRGLDGLTVADVNRVVREQLQLDDIRFAFVTPDGADLKARLAGNQPSPLSYNSAKPQALLDEDKIIAHYPLDFESIQVVPLKAVFQ
ncbi:pitrilysin family protein [Gallaecimonas sp. GXIMD4217]|uniref:M16 family metallopeptidase n=1 Tax=Gallaecimonas sp. GXIMD4217 TaxID=3131927 RepID=UPI00311AC302